MKRRTYILGIVIVFLVLAVGSCRKAGSWLVKEEVPEHADVMVMLMGSFSDRVLQVVDLYNQGVASKVWIVEESMGAYRELEERGVHLISNTSQALSAMVALGIPTDSILVLPGDASSTRQEAEIIRDYHRTQAATESLIVVTSSEHSRRGYKLFKAAFHPVEEPYEIYSSPSTYTRFNHARWWRSKDDIQRVVGEYMKLVNFALFERGELRQKKL